MKTDIISTENTMGDIIRVKREREREISSMLVPGSSCETLEAKFEVAPAVSTILADFSENKLCPHYPPFVFIPTGMNSDVFPL